MEQNPPDKLPSTSSAHSEEQLAQAQGNQEQSLDVCHWDGEEGLQRQLDMLYPETGSGATQGPAQQLGARPPRLTDGESGQPFSMTICAQTEKATNADRARLEQDWLSFALRATAAHSSTEPPGRQ